MTTFRATLVVLLVALLTACAGLPPQSSRIETHALEDTNTTRLGSVLVPQAQAHPDESAFHLLSTGVDALLARVVLTEKADRTLDLQYYIWHNDQTGEALADAVLKAADRGVRVRVLLDDLGTGADDEVLLAIASHPNVQVRLFNPVASRTFKKIGSLLEFSRINRRMHNKSIIADNQAAILGGRNIGDEYFGASNDVSFGDLDVLTFGPLVHKVSTAFDQFWNSEAAYPIESLTGHPAAPDALANFRAKLAASVAAREDSPYAIRARQRLADLAAANGVTYSWGKATLLYDDPAKISHSPDDAEGHLLTQFHALSITPDKEMLIVSPYFVPGKKGVQYVRSLTSRGVRVTILTNSLAATDVAAVHAGYQRYRKELLDVGAHLYELKPVASEDPKEKEKKKLIMGSSKASLHAKTYVFDRKSLFIGSMNLDPRSITLNTEIGVYCECDAIAAEVVDGLEPKLNEIAWRLEERDDANGKKRIVWIDTAADGTVKELDEPDVSAMKRVGIWFLGLLPIESQL
ncbi:phospholipase D family protein [Paraburkholderia saeva]|uniref:Cardiolipin synthase C n=1 Tax=Paraburkholderia saeva TaxID=2777537 RepID=A0A9N8S075_9BURK|nr:phospholipase D family protein [Paraburkholderia saeva]CAG4888949.1 Cardiolipin synthase C [Paraburkholderia saeva]CAG4916684.1 Cardiolipin synthase C [Paraburkholderia saeva]